MNVCVHTTWYIADHELNLQGIAFVEEKEFSYLDSEDNLTVWPGKRLAQNKHIVHSKHKWIHTVMLGTQEFEMKCFHTVMLMYIRI